MNSLQIGLIGIGVFVVALLALWHWWQQRTPRAKPRDLHTPPGSLEERAEPSARRDRREAIEPVVEFPKTAPEPRAAGVQSSEGQRWFPPATNSAQVAQSSATHPSASDRVEDVSAAELDADNVDNYVVRQPAPISDIAVNLRGSAQSTEFAAASAHQAASTVSRGVQATAAPASNMPFDERLHVFAVLTRDDGQPFDVAPFLRIAGRASVWGRLFRQSPWEAVDISQPTGAVISLGLALPIASRGGPVTVNEFDAWRTTVAVECANQNVSAQFEGFTAAAERAEELDSFLAAVDCIPITYLVRKDGEAWSGTRLRGTLEANGFRLQSDGRFAYHEVETEQVIFFAVDGYERAFTPERLRTESVAAFRLVMEAALLSQPMQRFDTYRQTLRALAKLLDAELRDSSGATVGEPEFAALRAQVQSASEALSAAGIAPGSPSALALLA
ncbi:MAG: hypothetical protein EAZ30_01700 [Betaproteobacteria bacterium]|nr:MAG: hypothetical protein EAZ30_01700 [Betaproteobacteria bacterium]